MTVPNPAMGVRTACIRFAGSGTGVAEEARQRMSLDADNDVSDYVAEALDPSSGAAVDEPSARIASGFAPHPAESAGRTRADIAGFPLSPRLGDVALLIAKHTDAGSGMDPNRRRSQQPARPSAENPATPGERSSRLAPRGAGAEHLRRFGIDLGARIPRRIEFERGFGALHGSDDFITGDDVCRIRPAPAAHGSLIFEAPAPAHENDSSQIGNCYLPGPDARPRKTLPLLDCTLATGTESAAGPTDTVSMYPVPLSDSLALTDRVARGVGKRMPPVQTRGIAESGRVEWLGAVNRERKQATAGRIRIVPDLEGDGALVVANVLSRNAPWFRPFDMSRTRCAEFTAADGSRGTVPMTVSGERTLLHAGDGERTRVLLAHADSDHRMRPVLQRNGIDGCGSAPFGHLSRGSAEMPGLRMTAPRYSKEGISDWKAPAGRSIAHLPRFDVGGRIDVGAHTKAMGLAEFSSDPDGIAGLTGEGMRLSGVAQSIPTRTDETGAETAAVSIAVTGRSAEDEPVREIRFDRPFPDPRGRLPAGRSWRWALPATLRPCGERMTCIELQAGRLRRIAGEMR